MYKRYCDKCKRDITEGKIYGTYEIPSYHFGKPIYKRKIELCEDCEISLLNLCIDFLDEDIPKKYKKKVENE